MWFFTLDSMLTVRSMIRPTSARVSSSANGNVPA
jgi:hypothetical protein